MNEKNLLIAIVAFAAGVCAMDVAWEWRVQELCLPVPVSAPAARAVELTCAHWLATGRGGWACS